MSNVKLPKRFSIQTLWQICMYMMIIMPWENRGQCDKLLFRVKQYYYGFLFIMSLMDLSCHLQIEFLYLIE